MKYKIPNVLPNFGSLTQVKSPHVMFQIINEALPNNQPEKEAWILALRSLLFANDISVAKPIEQGGKEKSLNSGKFYRYSDEQKMTEFGRSNISDAFSNFSFSSAFPIALAA